MLKSPRIASVEGVLVREEVVGVGIETMAVGADLADRCDLTRLRATESVACRAMQLVQRLTRSSQRVIDRIRISRRFKCAEPIFNPFQPRQINSRRRDARAEGGTLVSFLNRGIVAVPVELHAFSRFLIPDGR